MITVPISRANSEGEGSYHSIIPMLPWYNYFKLQYGLVIEIWQRYIL